MVIFGLSKRAVRYGFSSVLTIILGLSPLTACEAAPPSRVATYTSGEIISSTDVTSNEDAIFNYLTAGVDTFADNTIVNADINSSANIQSDKLNLTSIAQAVGITAAGSLTNAGDTTLNGDVTIGDASGDTLTIDAGSWVLTNNVTVTGTISDLGTVTTADINGGTLDGVNIGTETATGMLYVNNASDDADGLGSQGTSGQFLQSAGSGANPTWAQQAFHLLSTTTNTAQTNTGDITIAANKTYFVDLSADSAGSGAASNFSIRFNSDTGSEYAWSYNTVNFAGTPTDGVTGDDSDTAIDLPVIEEDANNGFIRAGFYISTDRDDSSTYDAFVHGTGVARYNSTTTGGVTFWGMYTGGAATSFELYSDKAFDYTIRVYEMGQ